MIEDNYNVILPPNWSRHYDNNHNAYYYYNHITLETTWILPTTIRSNSNSNCNSPMNNNRFKLPPIDTSGIKQYDNTINSTYHYNENLHSNEYFIQQNSEYDQCFKDSEYQQQQQQLHDNQKISPYGTKKASMPAHMLENPNSLDTKPSEYYSDMDSEDEICSSDDEYLRENGAYTMPVFSIPEQRGFLPYIHRVPKTPIIGGMNKDYIAMAKTYKQHYPYRKSNNNAICTLCQNEKVHDIFFPCEHRCVCKSCIKSQQICEEGLLSKFTNGYCMCPLCSEPIKLILEYENGNETIRYWTWVYEVIPPLPTGFQKKFLRSAKLLEIKYHREMDKLQRKKILASIDNEDSCTIN
jgi:hypothetical protein